MVGSITGDSDGPEVGCRVGDFDVGFIEGSTDVLGVKLSVSEGDVDGLGLGARVSDGGMHEVPLGIHLNAVPPAPFSNLQHDSPSVQSGPVPVPSTVASPVAPELSRHVFPEAISFPMQLSGVFVHAYLMLPLFAIQQYCGQLLLLLLSMQPLS